VLDAKFKASTLNYDLIVAGSPIYGERPLESVLRFLRRDDMRGHNIALFVVCYAGVFGMRNFMVRRYLDELQAACRGHVIYETSFDAAVGPWRKLNRELHRLRPHLGRTYPPATWKLSSLLCCQATKRTRGALASLLGNLAPWGSI
jgi:hypothetical protein